MISDTDLLAWMKADSADTAVLRGLEQSAIAAIQKLTGRYFGVTATITEIIRFRGWPLLLKNDVTTLTSLEQWDGTTWSLVPVANYSVNGSLVYPESYWPAVLPPQLQLSYMITRFRAIYSAGYTVSGDPNVWPAPADIQQAVKLLVGHWFENRESVVVGTTAAEVPMSVQYLLDPYKRVSV